ncbi:ParB/RepB/Spo0J family partition protein [Erythrobacter crassostreae]|uniref:ParB/RepB/Spo0J family partition protein n=1 Tax=Erythrobacter crassostreae TaxID=2828328 RepID=A0A9X1JLQ1_9SPHN|nr:ParB/RepB/Spo0J family partition protein [Erythrobacter crassostrea]MBV7258564.1 ParB/RepB/Spo0J family partition protein [Erythrobacter crassostrea]
MSKNSDPIRFSVPQRSPADKKKKLGKGLGALLGETKREEPLVRDEVSGEPVSSVVTNDSALQSLSIASIKPLPGNPRKHFDQDALEELAASIAKRGVIQPIIVRPRSSGKYELVAGERRWRAAQKARLHEIPALVRDLDDREVMALALIENLQREDLNPVEEARAYQRLADQEGMTQAEIARMVEKSRSHVANTQRLLNLPEKVLDLVEGGKLSMGHARALIGQDDASKLASKAVNDNLSVREIEKLVRQMAKKVNRGNAAPKPGSDSAANADIAAVQNHLEEFLGLPVRIKSDDNPRTGSISIRYASLDQLDLVCQRLTGGEF